MKKLIIILLLSLCVGACTSKPARFYLLTPTYTGKIKNDDNRSINIGLGPVNLPKYIDMPQIITRDNQHQVYIDEFHRWSSSLMDNIQLVLNENLNYLLPHANIFEYPWKTILVMDYQIEINIWRMDVDQLGNSILKVNWLVYANEGTKLLINRTTSYQSKIPCPIDYKIYAADMSHKLSRLSRDIANAIAAPHSQ